MDTKAKKKQPRPVYLRDWRKFMGTKATALAEAIGIERESYYRLERFPYRINNEEMVKLADTMGVRPDQFWWKPPVPGATEDINLNDLVADIPKDQRAMVIKAVRGMVGK